MFKKIRGFFGSQQGSEVKPTSLPEGLRLAAAVVLVAAAKADNDFASSERELIISTIEKRLELPRDKVEELVARAASLAEGDSLESFLSDIRKNFNPEQLVQIVALAWNVIDADGIATREESQFAVALRTALGLSMEQALRARKMAEDVKVDGFKETVESSEAVIQATDEWEDKK